MEIVTKAAEAQVLAVEDSTNPNGEFDVILSTDALDRDGERLHTGEWKTPLPEHITIDSDHDMSVVSTVGSGKPFINDAGQLQVRGTFASTPHAQNVRTLVNEGHIKTVSVAFRSEKNRKDNTITRELLNAGFVAVPANPEAVVLSSKSAKPDGEKAVMILDDENVDPRKLLAGVDAVLDQAIALTIDCDRSILPVEVAQALDMIVSAGCALDEALEAFGIYDPDDAETEAEETSGEPAGMQQDSTEKSTAPTAVKAADAADVSADAAALRARALGFLINKTTEL